MSDWITVFVSIAHLGAIITFAVIRLRQRALDPLAPIWVILGCQALTFGVRPIMLCYDQPRFGAFYPIVNFSESGFHFASACGLASTVALVTGYELTRRRPRDPYPLADGSRARTVFWCLVGTLLAGVAWAARLGRVEETYTVQDLVSGRLRGAVGSASVGHGYETIAILFVPGYFSAFAVQFLGRPPKRLLSVAFAFVLALAFLLPTGGRSLITALVAGLVYVWHYRVQRLGVRRAALFVGALVAVAMVMSVLRVRNDAASGSWADTAASVTNSFDGFEALVAMSHRFSLEDVVWGRTYFESFFLTFIPKFIWQDKPMIFGALACEDYVYPALAAAYGNVGTFPVGFVAEALYNLWYFGLFVVPAALGFMLAKVEGAALTYRYTGLFAVLAGGISGDAIGWIRGPCDELLGTLIGVSITAFILGTRVKGVKRTPLFKRAPRAPVVA